MRRNGVLRGEVPDALLADCEKNPIIQADPKMFSPPGQIKGTKQPLTDSFQSKNMPNK